MQERMKVAVVGGTGMAGRHVVEALAAAGADPVSVSRRSGVDVTTGAGLDEALVGVQRLVDTTNCGTQEEAAARALFTATGQNLQKAAERAGVERLGVLSICGCDRLQGGYVGAKVDHENAIQAGAVPAFVLRATQFHEFPGQVFQWGVEGDVWWVPELLMQPVAVAAMAGVLAGQVLADELPSGITEVGGPQPEQLVDVAARLLAHRGERLEVRGAGDDSPDGRAWAEGALLPGPGAILTGPTFQEWLDAGERVP